MVAETVVADAELTFDFKLELAQQIFEVQTPDLPNIDRNLTKQAILDTLFSRDMAPKYEKVCTDLGWEIDQSQLERMRTANTAQLAELDSKISDAEENLGEIEVRDAFHAKAEYLASIGDHTAAQAAYAATEAKTAGAGPKLDLRFALLRADIADGDWEAVKEGLEKAKDLIAKGGDWERKNRLRVYEALFLMATREFTRAAELFLDTVPTFTATDVMSFQRCVFYTVALATVALDRPTLKTKVVDNPEILSIVDSIPHLHPYLDSLHGCRYADFFTAFAGLTDTIRSDRFLYPHFRYYMREARIVAYSQFLESYKSVLLSTMASAFGVSTDFLDSELADFIVAGRLSAKIDRVAQVVETTRPDAKNAMYQSTIRQGDHLLNKLQKLSKVIDVE